MDAGGKRAWNIGVVSANALGVVLIVLGILAMAAGSYWQSKAEDKRSAAPAGTPSMRTEEDVRADTYRTLVMTLTPIGLALVVGGTVAGAVVNLGPGRA